MPSLAYILRTEQNRVALWGAGARSSRKVMTWKEDAPLCERWSYLFSKPSTCNFFCIYAGGSSELTKGSPRGTSGEGGSSCPLLMGKKRSWGLFSQGRAPAPWMPCWRSVGGV